MAKVKDLVMGLGKEMVRESIIDNLKNDFIHIHCEDCNTQVKILRELLHHFNIKFHSRGMPSNYYYNKLFEYVESEMEYVIIALDEVDELINMEGDAFLLNILRAQEMGKLNNAFIKLVCIANSPYIMDRIRSKVKTFLPRENWILFKDYTAVELAQIVKARAEEALIENSIDESIFNLIGAYAKKEGGDARRAISYLKNLIAYCERNKVEPSREHLDVIKEKVEMDIVREELKGYNEQKLLLLYSLGTLQKDDEKVDIRIYQIIYEKEFHRVRV